MSVNKPCALCKEIVWHKQCFRCHTCKRVLNMNNYRGYEKKPYCQAHYPQPSRFTVVADTPEMQRVAANSRVFSNISYQSQINKKNAMESMRYRNESTIRGDSGTNNNFKVSGFENHEFDNMENCSGISRNEIKESPQIYNHSNNSDNNNNPNPVQLIVTVSSPTSNPGSFDNYDCARTENVFKAMYAYDARESDEVSFIVGDIITEGDQIDKGWMYGRVKRTGQFGMLPSNYVQAVG